MTVHASGLVVEVAGALRFVSASFAVRAVQRPPVTPIPGAPLGIALVDGLVVPVLELGTGADDLLLCRARGQLVGLAGLRVIQSGFFPQTDDNIELDGERVPVLDVETELQHLEHRIGAPRLGEVP